MRLPTGQANNGLNSAFRIPNSEFKILPGADVHLSETTLQRVDQGEVMTVGDGGKYILIEFPFHRIPLQAEEVLFQLMVRGIVPIISHPERNHEIANRPERYFKMIRTGCFGQLTGMSLTGELGSGIRRIAEKLLTHRLLHFIASDAHSVNGRPPVLSPSVREAAKIVGDEEARKMVTEYPQAILEGRTPDVPEPIPI
jgi:protein-tyrosine phosphatase